MRGLEARLARLETAWPTEENRLMALFWQYSDAYLRPKIRGGNWQAGAALVRQELDEAEAEQLIAFYDSLIARSTATPSRGPE